MNHTVKIVGTVRGSIWMPSVECTKDFSLYLERVDRNAETMTYPGISPRSMQIRNLRDALLHITSDGDFQSCAIEDATLVLSFRKGSKVVTRYWNLRGIGENADCFTQN